MPAHLFPPDTCFALSVQHGPTGDGSDASPWPLVKFRIRGYSAGSYTAAMVAKILTDPLIGHDATISIEEVTLGALKFPPRVYRWMLEMPNVLVVHAAQDQLSKVSIAHLEDPAMEKGAVDRILVIEIDRQAKSAGYENNGYAGLLALPRCVLPRRTTKRSFLMRQFNIMKPLEALSILFPYFTWLIEDQNATQKAALICDQLCQRKADRPELEQGMPNVLPSKHGREDKAPHFVISFPSDFEHEANRERLDDRRQMVKIRHALEKICLLAGSLPTSISDWLLGFVVPFALAEAQGSASKNLLHRRSPVKDVDTTFDISRRLDHAGMEIYVRAPEQLR